MSARLAGIYPQASHQKIENATTNGGEDLTARPHHGHAVRKVSGLTGIIRRSSRPTGSCVTLRGRSVTIGNNHARLVSATTYTGYGCGPSAE